MPRTFKPKTEIIYYKQLKMAGGGNGSFGGGGAGGYRAGQNLICRISHAEPGGWAVIILKDNLPGFLPTEASLKPGRNVLARYVCVSNGRLLLKFGNTAVNTIRSTPANWEEQLSRVEGIAPNTKNDA